MTMIATDASSGTPGDLFFASPGEMAARTRAHDWAATPLGPVEGWSVSLRTTVSTLLASRHAMWLWWGPDLIQFYNDAYRPSLGPDRHPSALGARGRETWAEIWPIIGAEIESIMARGPATWHEDHLVPITRGDRLCDVYWSYSYSPVRDDDGSVGGVLVTVQETTRRVIAERRALLLHRLAAAMLQARSAGEVRARALEILGAASDDVIAVHFTDSPANPVPPSQESDGFAIPLATERGFEAVMRIALNPRLPQDAEARMFVEQVGREVARAIDSAERARAERGFLESAFDLVPAFLAILRGPDHVFEFANPAYQQLIGHRDVLGVPVRQALPELQEQGWFDLLDRVFQTGEPHVGNEVLVRLQTRRGGPLEPRYVNFAYQQMKRASGETSGLLVTGTDVTSLVEERQRVERTLAESERLAAERDDERRRLQAVLEQAPLAIAITGPEGEIRFANPTFERLWGRGVEATQADEYSEAYTGYHLDGRPIESREWAGARALFEGETVTGEVIEIVQAGHRREQGRRITVWISAAPIRDAGGEIAGAVVIFRDITAERRIEQQLRDAQRLQAVGTLAGGVAHEVNNALQAAIGFGSFVLQALGPEHPQAPDMRLVLQSAERASRVSQQLLAYTRQQVTHPQAVDLHALTTGLRPVLQQLLGADKSLVVAPLPVALPPVKVDPAQVERVLINLVANARDALETGGMVTITIDAMRVDADSGVAADMPFRLPSGSYVQLSVADTGHGMTPETLAQIFDPFFTTKPIGEGTGLGLSMVYGTVKQHGGYIAARSVPGKGTTMEIYWPAIADGHAPAHAGGDASGSDGTRAGGRIALVVDDEPMVRTLIARTLEGDGYTVLAAEDGAAALDLLEQHGARPDLIVTDVIMPRLNGRQLYDAVANRWPGVPVLFISGHAGDQVLLQRLVPGGAPFLQKPFAPSRLRQTAAELVSAGRP